MRIVARLVAGSLVVLTALTGTTGVARAAASVAITISPVSLTWTVNDFVNQFLGASRTTRSL